MNSYGVEVELVLVAARFSSGWGFAIAVDIDVQKMQSSSLPGYLSFLSSLKLGKLFFSFTSKTGTYYFDGLQLNLLGSTLQLTGYIALDDPSVSNMASHSGSNVTSRVNAGASTPASLGSNYLVLQASLSATDMMLLLGIEGGVSFGTSFSITHSHCLLF